MQYRQLGESGLRVSEISLGTWLTFGGQIDADTAQQCVDTAFECGINLFDTADVYRLGAAEETLKKCLSRYSRDEYVLATKTFFPMAEHPNARGLSRKHIMESCEASLLRLGVDHIDLYQCHRFDETCPVEETVRAMGDLIRQGKILYWGVSQWDGQQISEGCERAAHRNEDRPIASQNRYHLLDRGIEQSVIPSCRKHGLGLLVYSPLAQGLLSGKYAKGRALPAARASQAEEISKFIAPWFNNKDVSLCIERFVELANQAGYTPAQLALAWLLRCGEVSSVICGASHPAQITENTKALDVVWDEGLVSRVEEIFSDWEHLLEITF
ncbi:MAG: aldo/keto reductase family protein [Deltaproteobacteria bacterium]|nr:aldo/keto reductase family protein [Deltaproteobacteria bacterium]